MDYLIDKLTTNNKPIPKEVIVLPCSHNVKVKNNGNCDDTIIEHLTPAILKCRNISSYKSIENNKKKQIIPENCAILKTTKIPINWELYIAQTNRKRLQKDYPCHKIDMIQIIISYIKNKDKTMFIILSESSNIRIESSNIRIESRNMTIEKVQSHGGYYNKYLKYKYKYLELKNKLSYI